MKEYNNKSLFTKTCGDITKTFIFDKYEFYYDINDTLIKIENYDIYTKYEGNNILYIEYDTKSDNTKVINKCKKKKQDILDKNARKYFKNTQNKNRNKKWKRKNYKKIIQTYIYKYIQMILANIPKIKIFDISQQNNISDKLSKKHIDINNIEKSSIINTGNTLDITSLYNYINDVHNNLIKYNIIENELFNDIFNEKYSSKFNIVNKHNHCKLCTKNHIHVYKITDEFKLILNKKDNNITHDTIIKTFESILVKYLFIENIYLIIQELNRIYEDDYFIYSIDKIEEIVSKYYFYFNFDTNEKSNNNTKIIDKIKNSNIKYKEYQIFYNIHDTLKTNNPDGKSNLILFAKNNSNIWHLFPINDNYDFSVIKSNIDEYFCENIINEYKFNKIIRNLHENVEKYTKLGKIIKNITTIVFTNNNEEEVSTESHIDNEIKMLYESYKENKIYNDTNTYENE
jgi:hypothetical protein